jgi:hypothetical protein
MAESVISEMSWRPILAVRRLQYIPDSIPTNHLGKLEANDEDIAAIDDGARFLRTGRARAESGCICNQSTMLHGKPLCEESETVCKSESSIEFEISDIVNDERSRLYGSRIDRVEPFQCGGKPWKTIARRSRSWISENSLQKTRPAASG